MNDMIKVLDQSSCGLSANSAACDGLEPRGFFTVVCRDSDGGVKWEEAFPNLVVTVGKNDLLDKYFAGSTYTAAFFMGLKGTGTALAADTMASHGSWTEITAYSNATRPAFTVGTASAGSTSNTASPDVFNINGTATVAGCFITTNNTKGGTTGILFSAADFASARSVISGDTLTVTYTISC